LQAAYRKRSERRTRGRERWGEGASEVEQASEREREARDDWRTGGEKEERRSCCVFGTWCPVFVPRFCFFSSLLLLLLVVA